MDVQLLAINLIRLDGGTQMRAELNAQTICDYAELMQAGVKLPAIVVFYDGNDYWLGDGFQRVHGAKKAGLQEIDADVRAGGTRRDAILFAAGANADHGLRRTNADKRRAVETLLRDEEWKERSDNWIAQQCRVSHPSVAKVRAEIAATCNFSSSSANPDRTTGKDGKSRRARRNSGGGSGKQKQNGSKNGGARHDDPGSGTSTSSLRDDSDAGGKGDAEPVAVASKPLVFEKPIPLCQNQRNRVTQLQLPPGKEELIVGRSAMDAARDLADHFYEDETMAFLDEYFQHFNKELLEYAVNSATRALSSLKVSRKAY